MSHSTEEEYLLEQLAALHRSYQVAAQPFIERLTRIRSLQPIQPIFMTLEQANELGITGMVDGYLQPVDRVTAGA